ncbi:hypothetical protein EVG20_g4037, partial [Dentipellis fragilis]
SLGMASRLQTSTDVVPPVVVAVWPNLRVRSSLRSSTLTGPRVLFDLLLVAVDDATSQHRSPAINGSTLRRHPLLPTIVLTFTAYLLCDLRLRCSRRQSSRAITIQRCSSLVFHLRGWVIPPGARPLGDAPPTGDPVPTARGPPKSPSLYAARAPASVHSGSLRRRGWAGAGVPAARGLAGSVPTLAARKSRHAHRSPAHHDAHQGPTRRVHHSTCGGHLSFRAHPKKAMHGCVSSIGSAVPSPTRGMPHVPVFNRALHGDPSPGPDAVSFRDLCLRAVGGLCVAAGGAWGGKVCSGRDRALVSKSKMASAASRRATLQEELDQPQDEHDSLHYNIASTFLDFNLAPSLARTPRDFSPVPLHQVKTLDDLSAPRFRHDFKLKLKLASSLSKYAQECERQDVKN